MISYILNLLGISASSGSIEYYLVLISALVVIVCCCAALIRYLLSPIDLLCKYTGRRNR